jgi:hypothetical protein
LLAGARTEQEIVGPDGVLGQLVKRLVERSAAAELTAHLEFARQIEVRSWRQRRAA